MKRLKMTAWLFVAAAWAFPCQANETLGVGGVMAGPSVVRTMSGPSPEFGYTIEREVQTIGPTGMRAGQMKEIIPPDVKKLAGYAMDSTAPEARRLQAVQAIATLSENPNAVSRLKKIALKAARVKDSSGSFSRVAAQAIQGLGESSLPAAQTVLEHISTGDFAEHHKSAAKTALKRMAELAKNQEPLGYW